MKIPRHEASKIGSPVSVGEGSRCKTLVNALTVDVEDYFQVEVFANRISRASWDDIPSRVEANVETLLNLFAANGVNATFFTLGWIAERHPEMVRRIAIAGHEIASHGYDHKRVDCLTPTEFKEDIFRSKAILEEITGKMVLGYRAPTFSIGPKTPWAHEVLDEVGYLYSSSIYPIRHDLYGNVDAPRVPFRPTSGPLWEFPLSTRRICGRNFPCSGGGYFRLFPYWLSKQNLRNVNVADALPCIFYTHPWEIDSAQPRVTELSFRSRFRHYTNLHLMTERLHHLIRELRWGRMVDVFADWIKSSTGFQGDPARKRPASAPPSEPA